MTKPYSQEARFSHVGMGEVSSCCHKDDMTAKWLPRGHERLQVCCNLPAVIPREIWKDSNENEIYR